MSQKDRQLIDEVKKAVAKDKDEALEVKNAELTDKDLETASGGLEPVQDTCLCMCGQGAGCGGAGGG